MKYHGASSGSPRFSRRSAQRRRRRRQPIVIDTFVDATLYGCLGNIAQGPPEQHPEPVPVAHFYSWYWERDMPFTPPPASRRQTAGVPFNQATNFAPAAKQRFDAFDARPGNRDPSKCKALLKFPDGTVFWSAKM